MKSFQHNILPKVVATVVALIPLLFVTGCHNKVSVASQVASGEIYGCDSFAIFPDRFVEGNKIVVAESPLTLLCDSDSGWSWHSDSFPSGMPTYQSDQPLVDALFNRALLWLSDSATARPEHKVHSIWLAESYLFPEASRDTLLSRISNGEFSSEKSALPWPVSSDRCFWIVGGENIANVLGDTLLAKKICLASDSTLRTDFRVCVDRSSELASGSQTYLLPQPELYPEWMDGVDIYQSQSLGSSVALVAGAKSLMRMQKRFGQNVEFADSVSNTVSAAIENNLWQPNLNYYSAYEYSFPYPIQLQAADNMAHGLGIVFDVFEKQRAAKVVAMAPVFETGVPVMFPMPRAYSKYLNLAIRPLVQTYAALGAAKTGNESASQRNVAFLLRQAIVSPERRMSASGIVALVFRMFAGVEFVENGIRFSPSVPNAFPGIKRIEGFHYRNSMLNITINGAGDSIASFAIDGKNFATPFFPASMTGQHNINIRCVSRHKIVSGRTTVSNPTFMPTTPLVRWTNSKRAFIANRNVNYDYEILVDGQYQTMLITDRYKLFNSNMPVSVSFLPVEQSMWLGFSSAPHISYPAGTRFRRKCVGGDVDTSGIEKGKYIVEAIYDSRINQPSVVGFINVSGVESPILFLRGNNAETRSSQIIIDFDGKAEIKLTANKGELPKIKALWFAKFAS